MAGVPEADEAAEGGGGGIRSVLTMGSLVSPSGNEVLHLVASQNNYFETNLFSQFVFSSSASVLSLSLSLSLCVCV